MLNWNECLEIFVLSTYVPQFIVKIVDKNHYVKSLHWNKSRVFIINSKRTKLFSREKKKIIEFEKSEL